MHGQLTLLKTLRYSRTEVEPQTEFCKFLSPVLHNGVKYETINVLTLNWSILRHATCDNSVKFDVPSLLVSHIPSVGVSAVKRQLKSVEGRLETCFTFRQQVLLPSCEAADTRLYVVIDDKIVSA
jgi:hypothetical protein